MTRRALAAGAASGVLLWLASPAVGAGWLAWVALVPAAAAAIAWRSDRAGRLAVPLAYGIYLELLLVPALPFGLTEGQWNHAPVPVLIGDSPVLPVALVAVPLFAALLYVLHFGQAPGAGALALVAVPALSWAALDFIRTSVDPGGLFGPLYLSQHDSASAQVAALAGPWLLTLAIVAVGYAIALALVRGPRTRAALAAGVVLASAVGAAAAGPSGSDAGGLTLGVVQPGYDTAEDDRPELRFFEPGTYGSAARDTIRDLTPLTLQAARRGADLVVWPEAAIWVDPAASAWARPALTALARRAGVVIVVPRFLNHERSGAAVVARPDGAVTAAAPKQRPMWFLGERAARGADGEPLDAGGLAVGTLLGVDGQASGLAAGLAKRGAAVLAASTHDWDALAVHHRAAAQVHAAAVGLPLARADWRYGSAIYGRGGRIVADSGGELRRTVIVGEVGRAAAPTPYARAGDWLGWLSLVAAALAWLAAAVRRRATWRSARGAAAPWPAPAPPRGES